MKSPTVFSRVAVLAFASGFFASAALRAEASEKSEKPVPPGVLKKFDKDGDGKLNDEEKAAWKAARDAERKAAIEKYDTNKDGKLDDSEKAAMKADKKKNNE